MDGFKTFLDKTDCPFNWDLSQIDVDHNVPMVVRLKEKIHEKDTMDEEPSDGKWPLTLMYGYELLSEDPVEAEKAVNEAIEEIVTSKEYLNVEYRVSFLHIALSTKTCMILKKDENPSEKLGNLIDRIKPVTEMSDAEFSGVLAMKAQIFRYYGPDGTNKSLSWLREAVRKNPKEPEWKISLVMSLNRKRHFFKGVDIPWEDVEEPVNILEEVLCCPELTQRQVVTCEFFLAVAYHDYCMGKSPSPDVEECRRQILRLCNNFYDKTNHPQYVTFAAERFAQSRGPEKNKAMEIIDEHLKKFPNNVGVHTTACKILKRQQNFAKAAEHAQIALDLGGYGAAWLLLECKTKMGVAVDAEEFFNDLLSRFQDMFKKQTHLSASLYYFFSKKDPVKGARHFEQALNEDPEYDLLRKPNYCPYVQSKVVPIEIAYNQVVLSLRSQSTRDDKLILYSTKRKIEQVTDVKIFNVTQNLVGKALAKSQPKNPFPNWRLR